MMPTMAPAATTARRIRPPIAVPPHTDKYCTARVTADNPVSSAGASSVHGDGRATVPPEERTGANGSAQRPVRDPQDVNRPQSSGHQQTRNPGINIFAQVRCPLDTGHCTGQHPFLR
jgi:hypothetical protein